MNHFIFQFIPPLAVGIVGEDSGAFDGAVLSAYDLKDFTARAPAATELGEAFDPSMKMRGLKKTLPKAVSLEAITFKFNSDNLADEAKSVLMELGAARLKTVGKGERE